ncbi:hypothetical protein WMY93_020958 [Mugilogobius chulae]|uniref:C-type lectin domain-containing protein n=1 Tax=Mugilogobius chulae TaxID=88201 RepID=A0AAW0NGE9_9GOBI
MRPLEHHVPQWDGKSGMSCPWARTGGKGRFGFMLPHCCLQVLLHQTAKTWLEAQKYCRTHYKDLATFKSLEDIQRVEMPSGVYTWFGMNDEKTSWGSIGANDSNSWKWSATGTTAATGEFFK